MVGINVDISVFKITIHKLYTIKFLFYSEEVRKVEIIDVIVHTKSYWASMVLIVVMSATYLLVGTFMVYASIFGSKYRIGGEKRISPDYIIIGILMIYVGTAYGVGTYELYNQGASISYKATVTDFNEVNANGYEIVYQEGDIYTLEKIESNN